MNLLDKLWGRGRTSNPAGAGEPARRFRPSIEALEGRDVPSASAFLSGGTLQINADPTGGSVEVSESYTLQTTFVPGQGFVTQLVPTLRVTGESAGGDMTRSFNKSAVSRIIFSGRNGADTFDNRTNVPCTAWGSGSPDVITGGSASDTLFGDSDNDTVRGEAGIDWLYGGVGNDTLYGGADGDILHGNGGNDGLFGGGGHDHLWGGTDADRLLIWDAPDSVARHVLHDNIAQDAVIVFHAGTEQWAQAEIERVDAALAVLHRTTATTTLLKDGGDRMKFKKDDGGGVGFNSGGTITLTDFVLNGNSTWEIGYILHEVGHNWENESPIWDEFKDLSGWTRDKPAGWTEADQSVFTRVRKYGETWWYLTDADFASGYAKTHPLDDFAESFSAYFLWRAGLPWYTTDGVGAADIPEKYELIDGWVRSLSEP
jgi:hypothetical protein